ncbi:RHS repeat domain-containing protein [Solwaraspora sp. WMMB762]|uniref:RHS repeat domain-containing protein n=1 Tax=Solwaraspora sp. WMMB762 TaxID=3404120 RepID=UPI003B940C2A
MSVAAVAPPAPPVVAAPAGLQPRDLPTVETIEVPPRADGPDDQPARSEDAPAPVTWPQPGAYEVDLTGSTMTREQTRQLGEPVSSGQVRVPGTPIWLAPASTTANRSAAGAGRVRVEVLDRDGAASDWDRGVVMRLTSADEMADAGRLAVSVDYSGFAAAYGADWALRLRLVELPDCALADRPVDGCVLVPLPSRNHAGDQRVTAEVELTSGTESARSGSAGTLVALMADAASTAGDYGATQLQPSSTWSAGGGAGNFAWSYPMRVPPSLGGPQPSIALSYSSSNVDGRSEATNNQPSWIGEGFEYAPGFIERRYRPCREDMSGGANNTVETGDLCWARDNAVLSLSGSSVELIRDGGSGAWKPKHDDGSRVQRLTNTTNADNDNEYWKVTTADGTQYFFGLDRLTGWTSGKPTTQSVWTVPVAGNHSGEPCHGGSFSTSFCDQAWRWNLDYVVDPHGNTMSLWYSPQTNKYGRNLTAASTATYTRGGVLQRIDYGTDNRGGTDTVYTTTAAPAQVVFQSSNRCLTTSCSTHNEPNWPDTPWDQSCTGSTCSGQHTPTFWSTSRLASVTTKVWNAATSSYRNVDSWALTHDFPSTEDGTRRGLWLDSIAHTGHAGSTPVTLPRVSFDPVKMANRVDTIGDSKPTMNWSRIDTIWTETGAKISVRYTAPQCQPGVLMPSAAHTNTLRCYPVITEAFGGGTETDYFHKYLVATVYEADLTGGGVDVVTAYEYVGNPAWRYTKDDGLTKDAYRTWSDYRGYATVRSRVGAPGQETLTETKYLRGMHGDRSSPSGGTRSVQVSASIGDPVNDEDAWSGMVREQVVYDGVTSAPVSKTVNRPWQSAPTATRTIGGFTSYARYTGVDTAYAATMLDGGRGWRTTKVVNTYDSYGMITEVNDLGHVTANGVTNVPGDDRCQMTTYVRNTSANILDLAARSQTFALPCGQPATNASHIIGDTRTSYDGQAYGTAPTKGDVTRVEVLKDWAPTGGGTTTWQTAGRASYDPYGRAVESWDVRDNKTSTAYTPSTGGPLTKVTTTNPLGWESSQDLDPAWGAALTKVDVNNRRTDLEYDALGRLVKVWLPNRNKSTGEDPNTEYAYLLRRTGGVNAVTTRTLNAEGNYITSYQLLDGLLRPRQTQVPAKSGGGTVFTETVYDEAGRVRLHNDAVYDNTVSPGTSLRTVPDWEVHRQTVTEYDRAGRVTEEILRSSGAEKWRTSTRYGGDWVSMTPPAGGTPVTVISDARGNVVEQRQHKGATTAAAFVATTYQVDGRGQLAQVSDPVGNTWTYGYDIRGRQVSAVDPDAGNTSIDYNDYGDVTQTTNGNGQVLAYEYDVLGRRTGVYDGVVSTATRRATWTYDTVGGGKGQLHTANRWIDGSAYTTRIRSYNEMYRPNGVDYIIPAAETGLAGLYTFLHTYRVDGSKNSDYYPGGGTDLSSERLDYVYDPTTGLVERIETSGNEMYVQDTTYTALGEPALIRYKQENSGWVDREYHYDEATRRLTQSVTVRETAPRYVSDLRYSYDPAGNVTKIADVPDGGTSDIQCFGYDHLRRLTEAWTPAVDDCVPAPTSATLGGPAPYWQSWTFNDIGNRLTEVSHTSAGDTTKTYAYPAAGAARPHALTSVTTSGPTGSSITNYSYDDAGNTITRPGTTATAQTLDWDTEGRLAQLTDGSQQQENVYTADGDRLIRRDATGKTLYLPGMEIRYATSTGTKAATRYYSYVDGVFAMRDSFGLKWLITDHQSTQTIAISRTGGQAITQRRQTPYGEPRGTSTSVWPNQKGFVGGDVDQSDLVHIGDRQYDADIGKFISVDRIISLSDPQQWNAYAYGMNSPVSFADPDGMIPLATNSRTEDDAYLKARNQKVTPTTSGSWTVSPRHIPPQLGPPAPVVRNGPILGPPEPERFIGPQDPATCSVSWRGCPEIRPAIPEIRMYSVGECILGTGPCGPPPAKQCGGGVTVAPDRACPASAPKPAGAAVEEESAGGGVIGICLNAEIQVGGIGGISGCALVDWHGIGGSFAVKSGAGPAVAFPGNVELGFILSPAERMENLEGAQPFVSGTAGEGPILGAEVAFGDPYTVQYTAGFGGLNVGAPIIPVSYSGGVVNTRVGRWFEW